MQKIFVAEKLASVNSSVACSTGILHLTFIARRCKLVQHGERGLTKNDEARSKLFIQMHIRSPLSLHSMQPVFFLPVFDSSP
jgi:hypothetical protein